jgi:hypothetical protein
VNDGDQKKRRQLNGKSGPDRQGGMLELTGRTGITRGYAFFGVKKIDGQEDEQKEQRHTQSHSRRSSICHRLRQS